MTKPIMKLQDGNLSLSIFERTFENDRGSYQRHSANLQKAYQSDDGQWKNTTSLDLRDLPRAITLMQSAYGQLAIKATNDQVDA